jgi:hypothetical protein
MSILFSVIPQRPERRDLIVRLAGTVQSCARAAAAPVNPGESIKAQYRRASTRLGYNDLRSQREFYDAWYGRAGTWGSARLVDFTRRYRRFISKIEKHADERAKASLDELVALLLGDDDAETHSVAGRLARTIGRKDRNSHQSLARKTARP